MNTKTHGLLMFLLVFIVLATISVQAGDDNIFELTVKENDNLITLCKKYLEDPQKWPEIARLNRLNDFNYIVPGQRLLIPVRLLKRMSMDGRVAFIKGDVTVQTAEKGLWKPLLLNDVVRQGDLIKTGHESAVEIIYPDGTTFYQAPDTVLELTTSQQKGSASLWHRFLLSMGRLVMKIRSATGKESRTEITTPAAAFLARGTEFRIAIDAKEAANSEVLQGSVEAAAMWQTVMIREGEGTRVNKGEPPLKPRKLLPPPALLNIQPLYGKMPFGLTFERIEGAVAYRILLSIDTEGKNVVREKVIKIGEALEMADLENGIYYLQSRSIDDLGLEGASLAPQKITVLIKPQPPTIQTATLDHEKLRITWSDQGERMIYHCQIARDKNFLNPIFDKKVNRMEITIPKPQGTGSYYVRISAIDPLGQEGEFSPPRSVDVKSSSTLAIVIGIVGIAGVVLLILL